MAYSPSSLTRLPDLQSFDRDQSRDGLLRVYATRRTATLAERVTVVLLATSGVSYLTTPLLGLLVLSIMLPCLTAEHAILRYHVRNGLFDRRQNHIAATVAAASEALGIAVCLFVVAQHSDIMRFVAWVGLLASALSTLLIARYHWNSFVVRIAILTACALALIVGHYVQAGAVTPLLQAEFFSLIVMLSLSRNFFRRLYQRERSILKTERELIIQSEMTTRLALVAEHANDSVIILDKNHKITWVNPQFSKITGFDFDKVIGSEPADFLFHPECDPDEQKILDQAVRDGKPASVTLLNKRKDGARIWMEIHQTPIFDNAGNVAAFVSVERDATQTVQQQSLLEQALVEAEKADRAKVAFLSRMSHELRTPINGVVGALEVLNEVAESTVLSPDLQIVSQLLGEAAPRMEYLIDDLLNYSDIHGGSVDVRRTAFDASALLNDVVEEYRHKAKDKGITLITSLPEEGQAKVFQDKALVRRLVDALMSNAVKFTDSGDVHIAIRQPDPKFVRILIRDSGIGIKQRDLGRIFRSFEQAEESLSRQNEGAGLGLSLAYEISKMLGGHLSATSEPGAGSCFVLDLPISAGDQNDDDIFEMQESSRTPLLPQDMKVLVADDSGAQRLTLEHMVAKDARQLSFAVDGQQAVAKYEANQPDIILMDITMPNKNGFDATREIRALEQANNLRRVPILAVTTHTSDADRRMGFEVGMDGFLAKPVKKEHLMQKLGQMLN